MRNKKFFSIIVFALTLATCNTTPREVEIRFTVDLWSPQLPVGEIEAQIGRAFPLTGLKKVTVTVSYYPYDDAVCLRYRSDFFTYLQFWSIEGREAFLKALQDYNGDYTKRNLEMRDRGAKSRYGIVEGYLAWQMQSFTRRVSANMDVELGYAFNDRSPYYAVTQKQALFEDPISEENNMASQEITMYFTRAQAQELAALFDQELLRSLVPPEMSGRRNQINPQIDYDDYYDGIFYDDDLDDPVPVNDDSNIPPDAPVLDDIYDDDIDYDDPDFDDNVDYDDDID
jgi:hypothetical protein